MTTVPDPGLTLRRGAPTALARPVASEALGTALLALALVGSAVTATRLSGGNLGVALMANAMATGAALYALIVWLGPVSGAHLNPAVTALLLARGDITIREAVGYVVAQAFGALAGVATANALFGLPVIALAAVPRLTPATAASEFVATFGLAGVVWACSRRRPEAVASVVAAYVAAGFFFTPTGFVNPALTVARAFTDGASGIRLDEAPAFVGAQMLGAVAAGLLFRWLVPAAAPDARADQSQ